MGEAGVEGFRPLGGVADHDQRPLEHRAFLLHAAGVGDQQAGVPGQAEEGLVVGGGDGPEAVDRRGQAVPADSGPGARVQRQQNGQPQLAQFVEDGPQSLRVVSVLRPVDRGQHVLPGLGAKPGRDLPGRGLAGQHAEGGLDDGVAGEDDLARRDAVVAQVGHRVFGRGAVQVGEDAGDTPVDLLGHRAVVGAQAGLDVHDRRADVVPGLGGGADGVGVALDQDRGRGPLREHAAQLLDHPADLDVPRLAADAGQGLGRGQTGAGQEHAREFLVVVLAGVQEPGRRAQEADNGRELDYFRPRSDDSRDIRRISFL